MKDKAGIKFYTPDFHFKGERKDVSLAVTQTYQLLFSSTGEFMDRNPRLQKAQTIRKLK